MKLKVIETTDAFAEPFTVWDCLADDYYTPDGMIVTFETIGEAADYIIEQKQNLK